MEGSVLSFLKAEWKVSDTGSAHWAFSYISIHYHISNGVKTKRESSWCGLTVHSDSYDKRVNKK
jgi:hypothetical protein